MAVLPRKHTDWEAEQAEQQQFRHRLRVRVETSDGRRVARANLGVTAAAGGGGDGDGDGDFQQGFSVVEYWLFQTLWVQLSASGDFQVQGSTLASPTLKMAMLADEPAPTRMLHRSFPTLKMEILADAHPSAVTANLKSQSEAASSAPRGLMGDEEGGSGEGAEDPTVSHSHFGPWRDEEEEESEEGGEGGEGGNGENRQRREKVEKGLLGAGDQGNLTQGGDEWAGQKGGTKGGLRGKGGRKGMASTVEEGEEVVGSADGGRGVSGRRVIGRLAVVEASSASITADEGGSSKNTASSGGSTDRIAASSGAAGAGAAGAAGAAGQMDAFRGRCGVHDLMEAMRALHMAG
ncbi:unnamed protein product, partial [Closterium sp. NIES-64]